MPRLYICTESHFPDWDGAPCFIVKGYVGPASGIQYTQVIHAITGEHHTVHKEHVAPAKSGMRKAFEHLANLRKGIEALKLVVDESHESLLSKIPKMKSRHGR